MEVPQEQKEMKTKIMSQLHEQYAINNNANLSSIIALVVALIVAIGYYGYVFIKSTSSFADDLGSFYNHDSDLFTLDALLFTYLSSCVVLAILCRLCIYQCVAQRKEQFIIDAIRSQYNAWDTDIFPEDYHPYDKKGLKIVQGLYGELIQIYRGIFVLITVFTLYKLLINVITHSHCVCSCFALVEFFTVILLIIIILCCTYRYYDKQIESYDKRQNEFKNKEYYKKRFGK